MVDSHTNYIQNLANDLKEYRNSYSTRNLHYMSQFAEEFFETEIMHQPGAKILWFALVKILYKSNFKYEKLFSQPGGKYMSRLAREFSEEEIGLQPATKIPW